MDSYDIERISIFKGVIAILPHYMELKLQPDAGAELNGLIIEALKWGRRTLQPGEGVTYE